MSSPDQWLENAIIFGVYPGGGGGGGGVTPQQVQEFAFNYEPATGVDDAFIVNLTPAVTALTDGLIVTMSSGSLQNLTDSPTLQVNALTPVPIVLWAGNAAPGDIQTGATYLFIYNEAINSFQLLNPTITTADAFLVQSNFYNAAIDSGSPDHYIVNLIPTPTTAPTVGFPIFMQVGSGNTNTGDSILSFNGNDNGIYLNDGSTLPAGALVGNMMALLLYSNAVGGWVLMNPQDAALSPTFKNLTLSDDLTITGAIIGSNGFNVAQFSDVASATDYFHLIAGTNNAAQIKLISSATNASFSILAQGEGGVVIGSNDTAGVNYIPMLWAAGTYGITHQIPGLTANRTILYPDGNVTLVPGTMVTETQGSWTPIDASGAGLTLSAAGSWARIGDVVFAWCNVSYPVTADASAAIIGGLPFTGGDNTHNGSSIVFTNSPTANKMLMNGGGAAGTTANIYTASGTAVTNAGMTNTTSFFSFCYGV